MIRDPNILISGMRAFDTVAGGFMRGEFVLGLGDLAVGKTILACQLAMQFALNGFPGMLITTEQSSDQLESRIYSNFCDIPFDLIKDGVHLDKLPPDKQAAITNIDARLDGKFDVLNWNEDRSKSIVADLQDEVTEFKDHHGVRPHWLIFDSIGGAVPLHIRDDQISRAHQEAADAIARVARDEDLLCIGFMQANSPLAKYNNKVDSSCVLECQTMGRHAATIFGITCVNEADLASMTIDKRQTFYLSKSKKGAKAAPVLRRFEFQRFENWDRWLAKEAPN